MQAKLSGGPLSPNYCVVPVFTGATGVVGAFLGLPSYLKTF